MRYLLRRVRFFFLLSAIAFCVFGFLLFSVSPSAKRHPLPQFEYYLIGVGLIALGILYAIAWWTTRKPSPYRNNWAIAASVINLLNCGAAILLDHSDPGKSTRNLIGVVIAIAGLYAYGTGDAAPKPGEAQSPSAPPPPAPARPVSLPGDRTHPWVRHLVTVISLAAELGAIAFWSQWAHAQGLHAPRMPWYILFTAAVLIATVIHECGHALLAWCFHMRLLSFNAGPFRCQKRQGKWSFRIDPEGLFNLGGAVRVVPIDITQPPAHEILMIVAGPFANLITGFFFLVAVLYSSWPHYDVTWRLVAFTASFSFIAAIVNLIPFMTDGGGYSDGAQLLQILTHSPLYDYRRVLNSASAMLVTPRRYKDLDINAILYAADQFPFTFRAFHMQLFAANYYIDTGRIPDARKALTQVENIVQQATIDIPGPMHTEIVFKQAWLNRNAAAARAWWDRMEAKKIERKNFDYWLAKASLNWIEGARADAEEAWKNAESEAAKLPSFGAYEFDRYRLSLLRQSMDDPRLADLKPADQKLSPKPADARPPLRSTAVPSVPTTAPLRSTEAPIPARPQRLPSASSPELAAAAAAPTAPAEPKWDPLSFIRGGAPEQSGA